MTSSFTSLQELQALVNLINTSFDEIKHACTTQGKDFPSLHEPFDLQAEAIVVFPEVLKAGSVITAAASQLATAVRPPTLSVFAQALQVLSSILSFDSMFAYARASCQYHVSSSLSIAIQAHVPEVLREAGPKVGALSNLGKFLDLRGV